MTPASLRRWLVVLAGFVASAVLAFALPAAGGVFIGASEWAPDRITHPTGYTGSGGTLTVDVCIDPSSPNASSMVRSVQNAVATFNTREVQLRNLWFSSATNIPMGTVDFESVALHELGHCIGLAHSNLASESGLLLANQDFAKSAKGPDNIFDLNAGPDILLATGDDLRNDDTSFHYFDTSTNDPYRITASVVDSTTYSRDLGSLPGGDTYPAAAERFNGPSFSLFSVEAVMNQGTSSNEEQRLLTADDVSAIRYAMSGLDELEGTSDDYVLQLNYTGLSSSCDVKLDFDNVQTGFAVCSVSSQRIGNPSSNHYRVTSANIYFNTGYSWFFNDETCGNGAFEGAEACDDGNTTAGDGCDPTCRVENGSTCTGFPSVCALIECGNSIIQSSEVCDDGDTNPGDGCDASCQIEGGWTCAGEPSSCSAICGDGLVLGAESCDDSGTIPGDGCDASCALESGWQCMGQPSSCGGICGDGLVLGGETCDDGGTVPGDGCDDLCQVELTWTCMGEPSVCSPPSVPAASVKPTAVWTLTRSPLRAASRAATPRVWKISASSLSCQRRPRPGSARATGSGIKRDSAVRWLVPLASSSSAGASASSATPRPPRPAGESAPHQRAMDSARAATPAIATSAGAVKKRPVRKPPPTRHT